MKIMQLEIFVVNSSKNANTILWKWQMDYPKRKIINITIAPNDVNYFMTIVYETEV